MTDLQDFGKLVLRLTVGGLLLFHGIAKVTGGVDWIAGPLGAVGLPAFIAYGSYAGEVLAPILAILGKFTRIAGVLIAINMFAAIMLVRRDEMLTVQEQGGGLAIELELLFLLGGVALALLGSGRYALSRGQGRWD
ncbi:MAG TPA: DoxX family protein [Longimicrobiales bacterium]